jgi:hypothetical protein
MEHARSGVEGAGGRGAPSWPVAMMSQGSTQEAQAGTPACAGMALLPPAPPCRHSGSGRMLLAPGSCCAPRASAHLRRITHSCITPPLLHIAVSSSSLLTQEKGVVQGE